MIPAPSGAYPISMLTVMLFANLEDHRLAAALKPSIAYCGVPDSEIRLKVIAAVSGPAASAASAPMAMAMERFLLNIGWRCLERG